MAVKNEYKPLWKGKVMT